MDKGGERGASRLRLVTGVVATLGSVLVEGADMRTRS